MITIVSGLPRSGTSLVMQMLKAGGMAVLTDGVRKPDENNPLGYFEHEKVKLLMKENGWLNEAEDKALKIIAQLLIYLPVNFEYKIIFVERDMDEVLISQKKMLKNMESSRSDTDDKLLKNAFEKQVTRVKSWLKEQSNCKTVFIAYKDIILNGTDVILKLNGFLGQRMDMELAFSVINPQLYRVTCD